MRAARRLDAGSPDANGCLADHTAVTTSTRRGNLNLLAQGKRCGAQDPVDEGTWTARGGTGIFAGASGTGTATTVVKGQNADGTISSASTYDGLLTLAR